jgi:hypothetical protein
MIFRHDPVERGQASPGTADTLDWHHGDSRLFGDRPILRVDDGASSSVTLHAAKAALGTFRFER